MLKTLASEERLEDASLVVDLQWAREHFSPDQQSDNAFWAKDLNSLLQARFATPTLLRPLP